MTLQIAIAVFPEITVLDAVGPYQVFSYLPEADVVVCAARPGAVADEHGLLHLAVSHTFDEVTAPDVIVVPGGQITYQMARDGDPVIDWIRAVHPHTTVTTSVCTGALLLAAAGLLEGRPATTHWTAYDALASYGARPSEDRVVDDGAIVTAAGVSSGIDMALTVVGRLVGAEVAQAIQLGIEYDPRPPFDAGAPWKAPTEVRALVAAMLEQSRDEVLSRS